MGQEIDREEFSPENYSAFAAHLKSEMELLRSWFAGEKFCDDRLQCGLELEGWLVGKDGRPAPDNSLFLSTLDRKCVVPELSKFNFELNVTPQYLAGFGLRDMRLELGATWQRCEKVAEKLGHEIVSVGILPTVTHDMLCVENMSPLQRYAALNKQVLKMRGGSPLMLEIEGIDRLKATHSSLMLESAATSIQVHLKVPQRSVVRFYNASVIASAFTVAMGANAPLLFGRQLWDDTRITVFEQAVDTAGPKPRVSFGDGYVESSILEMFESNLTRPVLLPAEMDEPPALMPYVRMHNGTIWNWNRPLIGFERDGQPHIRIEHRPISASPSIADLFADVALYLGLANYFAEMETAPEKLLSFELAKQNFYQAARCSLDAEITWIDGKCHNIADLLLGDLLEKAMDWLCATGARYPEIEAGYAVLEGRLKRRQNGAKWQRQKFETYNRDLRKVLRDYQANQATCEPVHLWN